MQDSTATPRPAAFFRRTARIALLPLGILAGAGAVFLFLSPRVVAFSPAEGGRAAVTAPVTITFSTEMDRDCVEKRFSVEPPSAGAFSWEGATLRFTPVEPWTASRPVSVRLDAGACSSRGLPALLAFAFVFTPAEPRIAFLQREGDAYRLMAVAASGGEPVTLWTSRHPVYEFDVSPDGVWLVIAAQDSTGRHRLYRISAAGGEAQPMIDCGPVQCRSPRISPDGAFLAFERFFWPGDADGSGSGAPAASVSVLPLAGGSEIAVSNPAHSAANPLWHPRGWLSYFDSTDRAILLDDLAGGRTAIPTSAGGNWDWSPDGAFTVYAEVQPPPASEEDESEQAQHLFSHLLLVEIAENRVTDLTEPAPADDAAPAFSPDGRRLAFARQYLDARFTPGRQLMVMDLAARETRALTQEPAFMHSAFRWSPDNAWIAFMRLDTAALSRPASLWIIRADGTGLRQLAAQGYLPRWLP